MGGVGGWFLGNIPSTPLLGQGKIKVGVRFILRFMRGVGGLWEISHSPLP